MYVCDVSSFEASKEVVEKVIEEFGGVDILVNNAGIVRDKLILSMKEEDFDMVINVNLKGAFNMIKHTYSHFMKKRRGRIISISSIVGLNGNAGQANYSSPRPADWPDQIHRQRAWRQKHHCQRYRSRVYRYGYDPAAIRQGKGRHEGADPHEASRHPGGYRQSRPVLSLG